MRGRRTKFFRAAVAGGAAALLFATASAAAATSVTGSGSVSPRKTASAASDRAAADRNGRWIAYSTAPAGAALPGHPGWGGSDVFVTSVGGRPKLVAGRGKDWAWNVCPAFSPNGRMLAFARVTNAVVWSGRDWSTIVVVRVGRHGSLGRNRLVLKMRGDRPRCPRWSSNSSRLAYLEYGRVVVRDLHGSRRHRSDGDPTVRDFDRSGDELVSPTGDLVARRGPDGTIVSRLDGSDQRVMNDGWTAGWSPDGRKLLFAEGNEGGFSIRAVSVDPPFAPETVVDQVPMHCCRSSPPGYGDVSWQPIPRSRLVRSIQARSVASRQTASAASNREAGDRNGRWIAYSTAPASDAFPGYAGWGSDVFVTSVGGRPKLVAGRGQAKVWNVCPAFSPNGRMLAFARVTNTVIWNGQDRSRIVIVRLETHGPIAAGRIVLKVRGDRARCPMWSSDSSRLAYLEYGRVVVRDLHGSRRHRSDGDPVIRDFDRSVDELVSPTGDLVARRSADGTIVSRLDGSDQRVIEDGWTAGWSPDGRKLLFWQDESDAWPRLRAVSVNPPFASETVVDHGPINSTRPRLPGYGDVSWQPIPDHRRSS